MKDKLLALNERDKESLELLKLKRDRLENLIKNIELKIENRTNQINNLK